jgi:hypothetical protein
MIPLRFNIIYTRGTIDRLLLFTLSLLKHSDFTFRLVSNGCSPAEIRQLIAFCASSPRLEFLDLKASTLLSHAQALNALQRIETNDYFCVMDSDIFATGDFSGGFWDALQNHTAVFSALPIWQTMESAIADCEVQQLGGRYLQDTTGLSFGVSYLAIYDNRALRDMMSKTGITFERYVWRAFGGYRYNWVEIPQAYKSLLESKGLRKEYYDTTKMLNILMQLEMGLSIAYQPCSQLQHIGGIATITSALSSKIEIRDKEIKWKRLSCQYIIDVLDALRQQQTLPRVPDIGNAELEAKLLQMTGEIEKLYAENSAFLQTIFQEGRSSSISDRAEAIIYRRRRRLKRIVKRIKSKVLDVLDRIKGL